MQSLLLTSSFVAVPLHAQDKQPEIKTLSIDQSTIQPPIQTGRPILSWWDVTIQGSALVEGRFEFQLKNDGKLLATVTTEELALTGPQQRIRILFPPVDDQIPIDQLQVQIAFRGTRIKQELGTQILRVALARSRTFMVLTSASRLVPKRSVERDRVVKRLAFESMVSDEQQDSVKTVTASLEPGDLPQEPLAYCAYEMVVLFGDEFRLVKKPQLDAIAAWVRAGGSLFVEPSGVLEPYHVDFLRKLTVADPRGIVIQPDSHGRLMPGTICEDERIVTTTCGLGRVAIHVDDETANDSMDTLQWRRVTAFLWRMRVAQIGTVEEKGRLQLSLAPRNQESVDQNGFPTIDLDLMRREWLSLKLPTSTSELLDRLMPEGVRMVPLWVLGLILFAFVLWIGPVDYFGLGRLKARKFTWVTFPLATILVTGLTVWITNTYMSSAETRRGLVLRDVGDDGSIVRTNRFELLFVASTRTVTTDVRKGIFSPLGTGGSMVDESAMSQQMYQQQLAYAYGQPGIQRSRNHLTGERNPTRIIGRIPTQFEVSQDLAKWTPQLNRIFWIPGPAEEPAVDWAALVGDAITRATLKPHSIPSELLQRVRQQFGPNTFVACFGPEGRWASDRNGGWRTNVRGMNTGDHYAPITLATGPPSYYDEYGQMQLPAEIAQQGELFRWMYQHSVALPRGLFAIASSIGPKGGPDLDDLPIADLTNPNEALLIVVVPSGDDYIVYRKLLQMEK